MIRVERDGGTLVVLTLGTVLLATWGVYVVEYGVISDEQGLLTRGELLESVNFVVVLIAIGALLYGARWLLRSNLSDRCRWRVGVWTVGGFAGTVLIVAFLQANWLVEGVAPPEKWLLQQYFVAGGTGAVAGLLVGVYNAQTVRSRAEVQAQRDAFAVVNEFLRHHVLNGMQIIQGYTDRLVDTAANEEREHLARVDERSEVIVDLVRRVNALMASISRETTVRPVDLSALVREEVELVREQFADVEVAVEDPGSVRVLADDLLDEVVRNLLENAVEHNDGDAPRVVVSIQEDDDVARFSVTDNGPGLPEGAADAIFEPGEPGPRKVGRGLGLYLVDALVQRYDGEIRVTDSPLGGATFEVELPRP